MESKVFNEDCMIGMARYPDKYFDLAIVDPPYGLGNRLSDGGGKLKNTPMAALYREKDWDVLPTKEYWEQVFRVSKNLIVFGANYFLEYLPSSRCFICWDKNQHMPTLSACELIWTSFDRPSKIYKQSSTDLDRFHPTQKPIKLYKWLLDKFAYCKHCRNEGSFYEDVVGDGGSKMLIDCENCDIAIDGLPKILDTHLGSGSSRIAAFDLGFDFTGFELDKDYFEAAEKRYQNHIKQLNLF